MTHRSFPFIRGVVVCALLATPALSEPATAPFSPEQRHAIETVIRDYLIANPDVLLEANAELDRRQEALQHQKQVKALEETRDRLNSPRGSTVLGNPKGKVTLVVFFDYNCPFCRASVDDIAKLGSANPELRIVLREFPVLGPESTAASRVALAASRQIMDVARRERYYRSLMTVKGHTDAKVAIALASSLGLDEGAVRRDLQDREIDVMIKENFGLAEELGINGVPAFVVGDSVMIGAIGYDRIQQAISGALK